MPLPRSLANIEREISEKKWAEARQWAGGRTSKRSTACQRARSPMARWPAAPRGSRRGSTNSRQGTAYPGSTFTGRRTGPPRSAGGASIRTSLGITSSMCVRKRSPSRRSCGQKCGRRLGGGRAGGRFGIYLPMGDVGRRFWTSSRPRTWEG